MRAFVLFALLAAANGYVLAAARTASPPRSVISMGLSESAASCLEEGCSVDMVQDLLEELKAESKELTKRQQALLILIGNLQALNAKPDANQSEIKKLVSAATRTFSNSKGADYTFPGEPLGYSTKPSKHNELD